MTVIELRKALENFPEDLLVVVDGYERGYDNIGKIDVTKLHDSGKLQGVYGRYDDEELPRDTLAMILRRECD